MKYYIKISILCFLIAASQTIRAQDLRQETMSLPAFSFVDTIGATWNEDIFHSLCLLVSDSTIVYKEQNWLYQIFIHNENDKTIILTCVSEFSEKNIGIALSLSHCGSYRARKPIAYGLDYNNNLCILYGYYDDTIISLDMKRMQTFSYDIYNCDDVISKEYVIVHEKIGKRIYLSELDAIE